MRTEMPSPELALRSLPLSRVLALAATTTTLAVPAAARPELRRVAAMLGATVRVRGPVVEVTTAPGADPRALTLKVARAWVARVGEGCAS